jgi:hypothetical protein
MNKKLSVMDQYNMLVYGNTKDTSGHRETDYTMVACGDIQLYYNPNADVILIVDKSKMLKIEMDSGFIIFNKMVARLINGDYEDCWEFHDGFLSFNNEYRKRLSSLREMYVGSKKFTMNS